MNRDMLGAQRGTPDPAIKETILGLGMRYQLLTQYTSFVAVEHLKITEGGEARTVEVPVEMPEGVSYEGVFGRRANLATATRAYGFAKRMSRGTSALRAPARGGRAPAPLPKLARLSSGIASDSRERESKEEESREDESKKLDSTKLAAELQGLAEKVAKEGKDGSLTVGKIEVKNGRVEVRIQLTSLSDESLEKLKQLGVKILAEAKTAKLVIATVDVSQLEDLAKLDEVVRVEPSV